MVTANPCLFPREKLYDSKLFFFYHQEEELRQSGEAKYHHLNEDLHVLIEVFAPPAEAYARMGHALEEIKKFLIPVRSLLYPHTHIHTDTLPGFPFSPPESLLSCSLARANSFPVCPQ